MKKVCKCCDKVHTKPVNVLGVSEGFVWFNCQCGSTMVVPENEAPECEVINLTSRVIDQLFKDASNRYNSFKVAKDSERRRMTVKASRRRLR